MNIKQIKDLAREAWFDQQYQDTEGGVPCSISFISGFIAGFRGNTEVYSVEPLENLKSENKHLGSTFVGNTIEILEEANKQLAEKVSLLDLQRENAELKLKDTLGAYRS